jgi:hypothetical protein
MNRLTKHEQLVLCGVFGLLLVGLAVKTWRLRHPAEPVAAPVAAVDTGAKVPAPVIAQ